MREKLGPEKASTVELHFGGQTNEQGVLFAKKEEDFMTMSNCEPTTLPAALPPSAFGFFYVVNGVGWYRFADGTTKPMVGKTNLQDEKSLLNNCMLTLNQLAGILAHREELSYRQDAAKLDAVIALIKATELWKLNE